MARIGKIVDFTGSRETITDTIIEGMTENAITGVNWSFTSNTQMHIYGEQTDLTTLKTFANNKGLDFTIGGDAPAESSGPADPPLTQDEIDAIGFFKQAFNAEMQSLEDSILSSIETRYNALNTTPITFADVPKKGIKHLRQRI